MFAPRTTKKEANFSYTSLFDRISGPAIVVFRSSRAIVAEAGHTGPGQRILSIGSEADLDALTKSNDETVGCSIQLK